jgi:hypothetical protein
MSPIQLAAMAMLQRVVIWLLIAGLAYTDHPTFATIMVAIWLIAPAPGEKRMTI